MFNAGDMVTVNNNNCQLWVNGTRITASGGNTPVVGAVCEIRLTNATKVLTSVTCFDQTGWKEVPFILSADKMTATLTLDFGGGNYNQFKIVTGVATVVGLFDQDMIDTINSVNAVLRVNNLIKTTPFAVPLNATNTITAPEGKVFKVATINSGIELPLNATKNIITFQNTSAGNTYSNLVLETETGNVTGCFSTEMIKQINDNNCDLVYQGEIITTEKYASIGETYSIVCRPDWIFNTEPDAVGGYAVYGRYISNSGSYVVDQWELSEDNKTVTKTLQASRNYAVFVVKTDQNVPIDVLGGVNNVYKVDADIMKALTKERFFMTNTGSGGEFMTFDYGQFILNLMQLPFSLPIHNIIGSEPIQLAKLETTVVAPMVNTDRVVYDLGNITISGNHGNLLDYSTKQAILHLPFSDPIILDNQYIIDETITVKLTINLYTGTGTYNIYSTAIDEVILTKTVSLGVNIPLANFYSSDPKQILTSTLEWSGDNKLRIAYIELVDTNSDLNNGFFNTPIMDDVILSEVKGFFTVINANLSLRATSSEKSQIQSMLQSGVIYK